MTTPDLYEKLLAKIDAIEKKAWRYVDGVIVEDSVASVFRALRVAIIAHGDDGSEKCKSCFEENKTADWDDWGLLWVDFPCSNLRAIAKELGVADDD